MKILVVEDEDVMREIVIEKLSLLGISSVQEAGSVSEAKTILEALAKDEEFDLIVSDYQMPGDHGGNLLRYIYEKKIRTQFVLFTSSLELDLPILDENFLGIIEKPHLDRLMNLIEKKAL